MLSNFHYVAFDRSTDILVTEKFIDRDAIRNGDYE